MPRFIDVRTTAHDVEEKFITFENLSKICESADGDFDPIAISNELCGLTRDQLTILNNHNGGIKGFLADNLDIRKTVR